MRIKEIVEGRYVLIPTLTGIPLIGAVLIYLIHNEKYVD